jgi:flagellar biosynthesis GTPase FlhF
MQIKRFEAKNMTAALCLIKKELGPEAVILSARSLKKGSGIFGTYKQSGVEVTAATDTYDIDKTKINTFHRNEGYGDPLMMPTNTNSSAEQKRMTQNYLATTGIQSSERNYGHHADEKPSLEKRLLLALYHQLLSQDVDPASKNFNTVKSDHCWHLYSAIWEWQMVRLGSSISRRWLL